MSLSKTPNISKHISRNGGPTIKASRKTAHDKVFFNFGAKRPFFPTKWWYHEKRYSPKSLYIGTNVLVYEKRMMVKVWSMTKFLC